MQNKDKEVLDLKLQISQMEKQNQLAINQMREELDDQKNEADQLNIKY